MLYDATGKTIEVGEQVEEKELPRPVADAMHVASARDLRSGMKVTRGGNVTIA